MFHYTRNNSKAFKQLYVIMNHFLSPLISVSSLTAVIKLLSRFAVGQNQQNTCVSELSDLALILSQTSILRTIPVAFIKNILLYFFVCCYCLQIKSDYTFSGNLLNGRKLKNR